MTKITAEHKSFQDKREAANESGDNTTQKRKTPDGNSS